MTTALCLVATGANYQAAGPTNYEYKCVWEISNRSAETTNFLNKEGAGGWKLISANRIRPDSKAWYFFYEREKH